MKKLLWVFLSLSLLLAACSKEENIPSQENKSTSQEVSLYGTATPDPQIGQQGVAQTNKLWHPEATITVRFLDGTAEYQELVKTHVKEWGKHICIRFNFVESGDAEVRIAFNWQNNRRLTWSYTGTDCKFVTDQSKPTVNFANWQSTAKTPDIKKGDVLRIFGQILGLEYEYRHLTFNPMWSEYEEDVEDYWMNYLKSFVEWNDFKKYVYEPLQASKVLQSAEYDPASIMVMPIGDDWVSENPELINATLNNSLSAADLEFIKQLYPNTACQPEDDGAIITFKTTKQSLELSFINDSEITINWGDGATEIFLASPTNYKVYNHNYASPGEHTVKIYGSKTSIILFQSTFNEMIFLDVSKCKMMKKLSISNNTKLPYLDVTKNTELEDLSYYGCREVGNVDISNCLKLKSIECSATGLSSIDLTKHTELETFVTRFNPKLERLDVSKNTKLTWLCIIGTSISSIDVRNCPNLLVFRCYDTNISSLDLSKNPKLYELQCQNCQLTSLEVSNCKDLQTIYCQNNQITSLAVSENDGLCNLDIHGNPIVSNQTMLTQLAQSLPDKTSRGSGTLTIMNDTSKIWIYSICLSLKWNTL